MSPKRTGYRNDRCEVEPADGPSVLRGTEELGARHGEQGDRAQLRHTSYASDGTRGERYDVDTARGGVGAEFVMAGHPCQMSPILCVVVRLTPPATPCFVAFPGPLLP